MAFLLYFVVILVSAASVMFGLDLMTSPLPSTPNVPIGRSAQMTPPPAAPVAKPARKAPTRAANERALSPVYPASPGVPKADTQAAHLQSAGSTAPSSAPAPQTASTPPQDQQVATEQPASNQPPTNAPSAAPQPAVAQVSAHCNLRSCAAAYYSFRASDCSYQPYQGARQVCTRSGPPASTAVRYRQPKAAYAARPLQTMPRVARQASDRDEFDEITRIVQRMTRGEDGDVAVQDSRGRIVIVRPGRARARAYGPFDDDDHADGD